jgi:glycosyltransferase involved in cell wall biosynthesis
VEIRVTPGVAGYAAPLGNVNAKVAPMNVGNKVPAEVAPSMARIGGKSYRYWPSRKAFEDARVEGKVGVKWVGPIFDESGYGEACRNYVAALASVGFPVSSRNLSFGEPSTDYGLSGRACLATLNVGHTCAVNVVYSPPPHFEGTRDPRAYNIGMFVWEMNSLPVEWVGMCNKMDEIWAPCEWNAQVIRGSGVRAPVFVFGHTVAPQEYENISPLSIPNLDPCWYRFYSIFQWSERKDPAKLLKAYLMAFTNKDPVVLIVKTYGLKYSKKEEDRVRGEIETIRREVGGSQPRVMLITKLMSKNQILGLHKLGDCFFLPHRAEGWGLPHFEACMSGKPVITTGYGGNLEFTKPDHSYLLKFKPVNVSGMDWFKWFTPDMTWADADLNSCIKALRHVFEHRAEAASKGALAKDYVTKAFNWISIGSQMKHRLEAIIKSL